MAPQNTFFNGLDYEIRRMLLTLHLLKSNQKGPGALLRRAREFKLIFTN